jgi:phosphoglycolate phosphatase-like HAD superfamily hydrolase
MPKVVIFDVDGVLLHLTPKEEDGFFEPFRALYGLTDLSRDWNSYRIRNDVHIVEEIFETHLKRKITPAEFEGWRTHYLAVIADWLERQVFTVEAVPGALELLRDLQASGIVTGIATANILDAARLRLERAGLWVHIAHARGAEGGGAKKDILARLIASLGAKSRDVIYIGDNLNDLAAGRALAGHFIGFSTSSDQRDLLKRHGAELTAGDHRETRTILQALLLSEELTA